MPRITRSSLTVASRQSMVSTVLPSRRMVTESATRAISLSLCEIRMQVMPWALSSSSRSSRAWLSFSFRLAVGSSRISSLTCLDSALAISTSCCLPTPRSVMRVEGDSFRPTLRSSSCVWRCAAIQSITPKCAISLPRNTFSVIDSSGTSASSWWMMMMPSCSLSWMPPKWRSWPSNRIWPV